MKLSFVGCSSLLCVLRSHFPGGWIVPLKSQLIFNPIISFNVPPAGIPSSCFFCWPEYSCLYPVFVAVRFVFDVFGLIFGLTDLDRFCDWSSECWLVLLSMEGCSKDGFWSCWFCKLSMVSSSDSDSVLGVVFLPLLSGCSYVSWFILFCEFVGSVCFFCIDCWTSQVFFSSRKRHGWTLIYVLRCFTRTCWPSWSVTLPGPCHSLLK